MECRICLEDDSPETMIEPCQCRGTAAYVHRRCLQRYFQFYPDGVCRVCNTQIIFYDPPVFTHIMYILTFLIFLIVIHKSNVEIQTQLLLFISTCITLFVYWINHYETRTMVYIIGSILFFHLFGDPKFDFTIVIVGGTAFYALNSYIPAPYLAHMMIVTMLALYTLGVLYTLSTLLDSTGRGIVLSLAVLLWNAYVGARPFVPLE